MRLANLLPDAVEPSRLLNFAGGNPHYFDLLTHQHGESFRRSAVDDSSINVAVGDIDRLLGVESDAVGGFPAGDSVVQLDDGRCRMLARHG